MANVLKGIKLYPYCFWCYLNGAFLQHMMHNNVSNLPSVWQLPPFSLHGLITFEWLNQHLNSCALHKSVEGETSADYVQYIFSL